MKTISLALLLGTLTACGTAQNSNDQNVLASDSANMLFSRDNRPVDGDLKEINIVKNEDGKYDLTLRSAFYDRINGKSIDNTNNIAANSACKFTRTAANEISKIVCSVDNRPVDGVFAQVTIKRNADRSFKALLRKAYFDRINGKAVDSTSIIADNLKIN